jgi:hypothetical protein
MKVLPKLAMAAVTVLGTLAGTTLTAQAAGTSSPQERCDAKIYQMCVYSDPGFRELQLSLPHDFATLNTVLEMSGGAENSVSSIKNNADVPWCFYTGKNLTGRRFKLAPYEDRAALPHWIDNHINSWKKGC